MGGKSRFVADAITSNMRSAVSGECILRVDEASRYLLLEAYSRSYQVLTTIVGNQSHNRAAV